MDGWFQFCQFFFTNLTGDGSALICFLCFAFFFLWTIFHSFWDSASPPAGEAITLMMLTCGSSGFSFQTCLERCGWHFGKSFLFGETIFSPAAGLREALPPCEGGGFSRSTPNDFLSCLENRDAGSDIFSDACTLFCCNFSSRSWIFFSNDLLSLWNSFFWDSMRRHISC